MAIFKKNEPQPQKPRERAGPPQRNVSGDAAISIIGQGMTVVGDITTEGIVRVEGEVRGTVQASKAVILGQGGVVDGNVLTEDAVIGGTVSGSIVAGNRLELQSTCLVRGEIRTRAEHLKLEEGARFAGQVQMIEEDESAESKPPSEAPAAVPANNRPPERTASGQPTTKSSSPQSEDAQNGKPSSPHGSGPNGEQARTEGSDHSPDERKSEAETKEHAETGK